MSVPSKKQKTQDIEQVAETAWEHYRNFLDSVDNDEEEGIGDVDELQELLTLVEPHLEEPTKAKILLDNSEDKDNLVDSLVETYRSRTALLPVLCSVAHYHLADLTIVETVDQPESKEEQPMLHLQKSLQYFPWNAKCWSVGANYGRMTQIISPSMVCKWYQQAAISASALRTAALQLLDGPRESTDNLVKEWIELLFLDAMSNSEYVILENLEEEANQNGDEEEDAQEEEETGYFSASSVEAVARFMSSMLLSTAGNHEEALTQLKQFDWTHRLHPNVWEAPHDNSTTELPDDSGIPVVYPKNVLPDHLYQGLCNLFAPDSKYWIESDYAHNGYFSYFMDIAPNHRASNLIEDVIVNHLLPRMLEQQGVNADAIVGAEWWVHTRPIQSNLGHNLHFDTDEALLAQEGIITHPLWSSVLYLTGNDNTGPCPSGSTIVLNQTPDSDKIADFCWTCAPRDNSFMLFPGNLLHGVLPCPGEPVTEIENDDQDAIDWDQLAAQSSSKGKTPLGHRLTFMVGFWARRVPEKMKERRLYGPCGPLPPATSEHSWITQISKGYDSETKFTQTKPQQDRLPLPKIYPAWESIPHPETRDEIDNPLLQLPSNAQRIDHRFFVKGPPKCFRDSLFDP